MSVGSRIGSKARRDGPLVQIGVDSAAWVTIDDAALPDVERELFCAASAQFKGIWKARALRSLKVNVGLDAPISTG